MKRSITSRIVSILLAVLMMIPALATSVAYATPADNVTYDEFDILEALSGHGRFSGDNMAMAAMAVLVASDEINITSDRAWRFVNNMYAAWAYISQYDYTYNGNVNPVTFVRDRFTEAEFKALVDYVMDRIIQLNKDLGNRLTDDRLAEIIATATLYFNSLTVDQLYKIAAPNYVLGIQQTYDLVAGVNGGYLKVYTSQNIGVKGVTVNGKSIANGAVLVKPITKALIPTQPGKTITYYENLVALKDLTAGISNVKVTFNDNQYVDSILEVESADKADEALTGKKIAINKVTTNAKTVSWGAPITYTATLKGKDKALNPTDNILKLTDAYNDTLAMGEFGELTVDYAWPSSGKKKARVWIGAKDSTGKVDWLSYKTVTVTVRAAAAGAKISKISASSAYRGEQITMTVRTNKAATRAMVKDLRGSVLDYTHEADTTSTTKYNYFTLSFDVNEIGKQNVYVFIGSDTAWAEKGTKKAITVLAPAVTKISLQAKSIARNTVQTLTVELCSTGKEVEIYDSKKNLLDDCIITPVLGAPVPTFTIEIPDDYNAKKGTKTFYLRAKDDEAWGSMKKFTYKVK